MKKVPIFVNLIFLIFLSKQVDGRVIHVPGDSSTIQKGINGAYSADTVLVATGIYSAATNGETFPINMKNGVVLLSEAGAEYTSIFADYDTTVICCVDLDSTTIIQGFQIGKGKSTNGGGVYCENSSLKIIQNEISANEGTYGVGIHCLGGSSQIIDNLIRNNVTANQGGGIYCQNASPKIIDNLITNNEANKGGGIYCENSSIRMTENEISDNSAIYGGGAYSSYGAGIYCLGGSPQIIDNTLSNNKITVPNYNSGYGAGIYCDSITCQMTDNTITNNEIFVYGHDPKGYGAGIYCKNSSGEIKDNLIEGNSIWGYSGGCIGAMGYGVGISCRHCTSLVISENTVANDTFSMPASTGYGGGIYFESCLLLTILQNAIKNNGLPVSSRRTVYGGGIYCILSTSPIMQNNLIVDNKASSGGGLYFKDTIIDSLNNNTVDSDSVGGIYCENSTMKIFNNIVTNSTEGVGIKILDATSYKVKIFHNDVCNNQYGDFENYPPGVGDTTWGVNNSGTPCDSFYNIIRDPLFSTHPDSSYHLQGNSPCIDAGDPQTPYDPDSTIADMGCFYHPRYDDVGEGDVTSHISRFELFQNYPNPFNSATKIRYELPKDSDVELAIYNILGQRLAILTNGREPRGPKTITWDGKDGRGRELASGIYFYRIQVGDLVQSRKILLLK